MRAEFWKKKLAARLHDPAEKAFVLMRDIEGGKRIGHEEGSVKALREALGIDKGLFDKRADHFAAAADRPNWPYEPDKPRPSWANVRFTERPILIHPLSGEELDLKKLNEVLAAQIRTASLDHYLDLVENRDGSIDYRLTLLAFWRFGPEPALVAPEIGELWRLLPADTRVPDHSIWAHLDIVSALAGAMADGGEPALLAMSFGPVQSFIAQARSTSDIWAGSHLLASLVWEGLKVVCKELGPDAVLFPALRGVAAVDRWLLQEGTNTGREQAWRERFKNIDAAWLEQKTDANPLFSATLPNKFVALVPAARAKDLAGRIEKAVRDMTWQHAETAAKRVFKDAERAGEHWKSQLEAQLAGFPEVHWAVAEWPVVEDEHGMPIPEVLIDALQAFDSPESRDAPGFFGSPFWKMVAEANVVERSGRHRTFKRLVVDGHEFFRPNAGVLYPAVHDLAERALAAGKAVRPFGPLPQEGYRCTLCGEREWLAVEPAHLRLSREARRPVSAWGALVGRYGIKDGEHLCGVCNLKRLWPTLFVDQVEDLLGDKPDRFVVSTHTMALATSFGQMLSHMTSEMQAMLAGLQPLVKDDAPVALPASLARELHSIDGTTASVIRRLPSALDRLRDSDKREDEESLRSLEQRVKDLLGHKPETYYALIQMDGDRMGAWLAGNEKECQLKFPSTWHPSVRSALDLFRENEGVKAYLDSYRPASPARHAAISQALNDFSTHVVRHIVEHICKGKLIYSGGDDVLAMVSVDDLLPAMLLLRAAYSGTGDASGLPGHIDLQGMQLGKGWIRLRDRLMLMMGAKASASIGAIVAHHQAPLAAVLRQLREAESRAKSHGRNAFCVRVMKRGGGEVGVAAKFWAIEQSGETPPPVLKECAAGYLLRLADALANTDFSRRAIYRAQEWLANLPQRPQRDDGLWRAMVATHLGYQFERQKGFRLLAEEAVELACDGVISAVSAPESRAAQPEAAALEQLLVTAEFFARESRAFRRQGEQR